MARPIEIELELELEPDDGGPDRVRRRTASGQVREGSGRPKSEGRRPTWHSVLALVAVGSVVGAAVVAGSGDDRATTSVVPPPSPAATASVTLVSTVPSAFASGATATIAVSGVFGQLDPVASDHAALHRPMLPGPTGLRLVARLVDGRLVRLDVDAGTIDVTGAAEVPVDPPALVVAGADWELVRPTGDGPGYLLRDGYPTGPVPLTSLLADHAAGVYPGDRPDSAWVVVDGYKPGVGYVQLVDLDGVAEGASLPLNGTRPIGSDEAGGVLVATTGGVYVGNGGGYHLLTTGSVVAASATHLVEVECDATLACHRDLVDRSSGARTPLGPVPPGPAEPALGAISPGGAMVAVRTANAAGIDVIDVTSGAVTQLDASPRPLAPADAGPVVWSDDGRFLIFHDRHDDHLAVFDARTGATSDLIAGMPAITAFAARPR